MKFVEFTSAQGLNNPILVNTDKVLALYGNGKPNEVGVFPHTFIELGPDGHQDSTGPIVLGNVKEVAAKLLGLN